MNEVDAKELKVLIESGDVIIVDVREQDEYDEAHIDGVHLVPMSAFNPKDVPEVPADKKLVFSCRSGGRSARMLEVYEAFYPDVDAYNFKGGIMAWMEEGFAVVQG
jgi:rhodanese-related sulfurtransferase